MNKCQLLKHMIVKRELTLKRIYNLSINYVKFLTKNPKVSGFPSVLQIEPTNFCNLKCPLCPTGNGTLKAPRGFMGFNNYKKIIDEVGDYLLYLILYNYGEPFLNKEIIEIIEYAKEKNIFVRISTNGHFFNENEKIKRLVNSGLDHLIIALDGATQKTFQKYRKGGNFQQVIGGIKNVIKEKERKKSKTPFIELLFVVMKHNEKEIPIIKRIANEIGVDRLKLKTTALVHLGKNNKKIKKYLPEDKKLSRYKFEHGSLIVNKEIKNKCIWLWLGTVVSWDGSVVPCCYDPNRNLELGNAFKENSLKTIWINKKYTNLRKTILKNKKAIKICERCPGTFTGPDTN